MDSIFRIPSSIFRIPDSAFRIPDSAFRIPDSVFRIPDSAFRVPDSAFRVPDSAFRVASCVFRALLAGDFLALNQLPDYVVRGGAFELGFRGELDAVAQYGRGEVLNVVGGYEIAAAQRGQGF